MDGLHSQYASEPIAALPRRSRSPGLAILPAAWAAVILWTAGAATWSWAADFRLAGIWHVVFVGAVLLLVSVAYRRRDSRIADMFEVTALWIVICLVALLTTALTTRTAAPLADSMFIAADRRLGFYWPLWTGWVDSRPLIRLGLALAYASLLPQFAGSLVYLPLTGRAERVVEAAIMTTIALIPALLCVWFTPALGPFAAFGMADRALYLPAMLGLRAGAQIFDVSYNGAALITFPSFHAIWALALVYVHRGNGWVSVAVAVLNAVVLVSVLSEGGHYLVDLLSGFIVAATAMIVTSAVMRRFRDG